MKKEIDIFRITEEELSKLLKFNYSHVYFSKEADFTTVIENYLIINENEEYKLFEEKFNCYKESLGYFYQTSFRDIKELLYTMTHYF